MTDGLNLHLYNTLQWNARVFTTYRRMLANHHLAGLPIWLSETNAAPHAPQDAQATPADQADFLVENLAASLAYAQHVEVYEMTDTQARVNYGLVGPGTKASPAYTAVKTITAALAGTEFLKIAVLPYEWRAVSKPATVTFGGVGRLVQVVWDQGFQRTRVALPAYARQAIVISANGTERTITAQHGQFVIALPPTTLHARQPVTNAPVGGPPAIVVQTVKPGQAGTPRTPPVNSPQEFAASAPFGPAWPAAPPLTATRGDETATIHPAQATVTIATPTETVTVGGWGTGFGRLLGPSGVAISPDGTVYVTNSGANDVVVFSATGHPIRVFGSVGSGAAHFNGPSGIAIGPQGDVYVADTLNQRVQIFSATGTYLGQGSAAWPMRIQITNSNHWQTRSAMQP